MRTEGRGGGKIGYNAGQRGRRETRVGLRQEFGVRNQEKFSGLKSSEWSLISKAAKRLRKKGLILIVKFSNRIR